MATLYITEQGASLTMTGERIVVRKGGNVLEDIPAIKVGRIVVFGNVNFTTPAVRFFFEKNIDVAYLTLGGRYKGRLQPPFCRNALLRRKQYERSLDKHFCLEVAKRICEGKIKNIITLCERQKKRRHSGDVKALLKGLKRNVDLLSRVKNLDQLRGYEGKSSYMHFKMLREFLKIDLGFRNRNYHPPKDPVNILLSLGYTLLYNNLLGAINIVGLDPYVGFYHAIRHGHSALSSDLMEEWRAIIVDSVVLSVINRGEITEKDFEKRGKKIEFKREGLKTFLKRFEEKILSEVNHPQLKKRHSYRRCIELQARQLASVVTGDKKAYMPFISR